MVLDGALPGQGQQASVLSTMLVLDVPQIHMGRGQGMTPAINDFNLEWLRGSRMEEGTLWKPADEWECGAFHMAQDPGGWL